ncbi:MAG: hypothetical protein KJO69_01660 [Gammaproteobacteria bacterium]|nr:hypothetical protein [Gammaproteobacteria bacterium]
MEDWYKHPALVAITLVAAIVVNLVNIRLDTDPHARPDAFTGTEGAELERELRSELRSLRKEYLNHRQDYDNHIKWGRRSSIETSEKVQKHETQLEELMNHHKLYHKGDVHK